MAAIDKIYVESYEQYKSFKDWCSEQPEILDKFGQKTSLINYFIFNFKDKSDWCDNKEYPIYCAPYYIDAYIIRNCPLDFIQKEMMLNYGHWSQEEINEAYKIVVDRGENKVEDGAYSWLSKDDFIIDDNGVITMPNLSKSDYSLIKEGKLYDKPYVDYETGKHFKVVKAPTPKINRPHGYKSWGIEVIYKDTCMVWVDKLNVWKFSEEFVLSDSTSTMCFKNYKTIKAVSRAIKKWKLPVGAIVKCTSRYIREDYEFLIF